MKFPRYNPSRKGLNGLGAEEKIMPPPPPPNPTPAFTGNVLVLLHNVLHRFITERTLPPSLSSAKKSSRWRENSNNNKIINKKHSMQNMTSFCADVIKWFFLYWTLFSAGSTGILRLVLAAWLFAVERRILFRSFQRQLDCAAPATVIALPGQGHPQSSGAVWKSRWPSWAFRPNEPYGFCGRKAILNRASALVTICP